MALNEQIVEETRYYRQCVDKDNKKWERYGLWNRGKDTECEDGNTVETKVGAIKGITTSTNVSETGYAADAKTVSEINQSLTDFMKTDFIKVDVAATSQIDIAASNMSSSVKTTPINVPNGYKFSHVARLYSDNSNVYVSMNSVSNNGSTVSLYLCGRNLSTTQQKGSLYGVVCFIKK